MNRYIYIAGLLTAGLSMVSCSTCDEDELIESRERVTAQMTLSVSGKAITRMTEAATQSNQTFQGMKDIVLIPFSLARAAQEAINSNDLRAGTNMVLDPFTGFTYQSNSNLYDITVPIGTNAFLVYGRSMAATNGQITATWGNYQPANISFAPVQIVNSVTSGKAAGEKGDAIITYLNTIFNANWANKSSYPVLNGLYPMVQDMKAGSSASVLAFIQEIYDALKKASSAAAGVSTAIAAIEAGATVTDGKVTALAADYQGYPADIFLPDGTAVIEWDETNHVFKAVTDKNNLGAMNVDVTNFVYPAELWYRTNSRIKTDTLIHKADYEEQTTWDGVLSKYPNDLTSVNGATQSVAVRQQMQYAVGRLDVKVVPSTSGATSLVDKEGTEFAISDLAITGILVGQQSPVDFQFQSVTGGTEYTIYDSEITSAINAEKFTHTLVLETPTEKKVNVAVELQNNSTENIVLDTKISDTTNTTMEEQIVPPGCKFYLVGQLDPATASGTPTHKKVFQQDEVTEVTFSVKDLTFGYYVIPPLSNVQIEFSLGVIDWKLSTPSSAVLE